MTIFKKSVLLTFLFVVILASFLFLTFDKVQAEDDTEKKLQETEQQIRDLQNQLDQTKNQEKTLKSQLDYIDGQTKLTQLKIQETEYQITKLNKEIADLDTRINKLSTSVDQISQILLDRIVKTYKYGNVSTLDLVFTSGTVADLLEKLKYLQVAQENDKKVLYELQATKVSYNDQKTDKATREAQQQTQQKKLKDLQTQLDEQKKQKQELLKITQNNEAIYSAKLKAALAEQQAILSILNGGGNEVKEGPVSKGSSIGYIINGPSACSSGAHLHFEVHTGNSLQDPSNYLSNISFQYMDNDPDGVGRINPHGSYDWPMTGQIYISQGYGMTPWAKLGSYGGGPHTGIDMYASGGTSVRAVRDGTLSRGSIGCGGGQLPYKKIDHGDSISTYYLHMR